ncbi:MAG: hypothetical protein U0263_10390 [Polyangiaceae bacterium]
MANDSSADDLAKWGFWLTLGGCVAYILVVALFILNAEPSSVPPASGGESAQPAATSGHPAESGHK